MLKTLDRYMLAQIVPTMMITLLIAAVILLLERMLRLLDIAVGNGVSALVVFQMLFNLIPHYMGLAIPAALFLGVLLAVRKLSAQSELDAISSSGISLFRLIRPAMLLAGLMVVLNLILSGYLQPFSRYAYREILYDVTSGVIESGIGEGVFTDLPNGYTLKVDRSRGDGKELFGVFAHHEAEDGSLITYTAKRGLLITGEKERTVTLRLFDGKRISTKPGAKHATELAFDAFDWDVDMADLERFRLRGGDKRELTLTELWRGYTHRDQGGIAFDDRETTEEGVGRERPEAVNPSAVASEFHSRIVFSLSLLLLPVLAAPLGFVTRRSSQSFGVVLGILLLLTYQKVLEFGEAYAAVGGMPAATALWTPFVLFALFTLSLFHATSRRAGITPMQALEQRVGNITGGIGDLIGRLFKRKPKHRGPKSRGHAT